MVATITSITSIVTSIAAIILSIYSIYRQRKSELFLKQTANVSASVVALGNNRKRLKIYNSGKALAKNVNIRFLEENNIIAQIDEKLPINLHEHQSVEFPMMLDNLSPSKIKFILTWDDDRTPQNEKGMELGL